MSEHVCKPVLRYSSERSADGQKFRCSCGKTWEYVQGDGSLGCYWVPSVRKVHDECARATVRRKMRKEAQRVWAER